MGRGKLNCLSPSVSPSHSSKISKKGQKKRWKTEHISLTWAPSRYMDFSSQKSQQKPGEVHIPGEHPDRQRLTVPHAPTHILFRLLTQQVEIQLRKPIKFSTDSLHVDVTLHLVKIVAKLGIYQHSICKPKFTVHLCILTDVFHSWHRLHEYAVRCTVPSWLLLNTYGTNANWVLIKA